MLIHANAKFPGAIDHDCTKTSNITDHEFYIINVQFSNPSIVENIAIVIICLELAVCYLWK